MSREFWYLQFGDVPEEDDDIDLAYKEEPGCKTCGKGDEDFKNVLKEQWNTGLDAVITRLCSLCGNTKECKRIKDELNKYRCNDIECNKG